MLKKLYRTSEFLLTSLFCLTMHSLLVGVLTTFVHIPWSLFTVGIIFGLSFYSAYLLKDRMFSINSKVMLATTVIILIFSGYFFRFSPVIELRQDPAVYAFKAFNLVNHGTTSVPFDTFGKLAEAGHYETKIVKGYNEVMNGAIFDGKDKLDVDFFPSGSYFYATLGEINKDWVFRAFTIIGMLISVLLLFLFSQFTHPIIAALASASFCLSPVIIWFVRAPYSEPYALMLLFALVLYLTKRSPEKNSSAFLKWDTLDCLMIGALCVLLYAVRIDLILAYFAGAVIMTLRNLKTGLIYVALGGIYVWFTREVSPFYTWRVSDRYTFVPYDSLLALIAALTTYAIFIKSKISISKIIGSKWFPPLVMIAILIAMSLIFRDNITPIDQVERAVIHGVEKRSYHEEIWDRLLQVFPPLVLIIGMLFFPFFTKDRKLGLPANVFLLILFLPFLHYLYHMHNSPQMWWALRRFIYVIVPITYLSFCLSIFSLKNRNFSLLAFTALFIAMTNLYWNLEETREMIGLEQSVKDFETFYPDEKNYLVLYNPKLKYEISPILSYGNYEFAPIYNEEVLNNIEDFTDKENIIYVTEAGSFSLPLQNKASRQFQLTYQRLGEDGAVIPQKVYDKMYTFKIFEIK